MGATKNADRFFLKRCGRGPLAFTVFLLVHALGCATLRGDQGLTGLLPAPGFAPGWRADSAVAVYDRETLYDYIDGEAELYYPYGFQQAAAVNYVKADAAATAISADVYEMRSTLDAFGIYANYRSPEAAPADIGCEGFRDDYQLMFCQGRYFVRLSAVGSPEQNREHLAACARAIADNLPGDTAPPPELALVTIHETVPRTQRYIAESLLGYDFFPRGLDAQATLDGKRIRLFAVLLEDEAAAHAALDAYAAFLDESGAKPRQTAGDSRRQLAAHDPFYGGVVIRQAGRYLLGVAGLDEPTREPGPINRMGAATPLGGCAHRCLG